MLLALTGVFVAYVVSGVLAHPDWTAAATGLVVPGMPPTWAPPSRRGGWPSAVDKRLKIEDLGNERIDVIVGAVLTGVIGLFMVIACAATLHQRGISITDARRRRPSAPAARR